MEYRAGFRSYKLKKYHIFSREKIYRLQADWLRDPTIISSWWTREEEIKRYGGAVLLPYEKGHTIFSFSGLDEHVDEAVSLMVGREYADDDSVRRIIEQSKNLVYPEMFEMYQRMAA